MNDLITAIESSKKNSNTSFRSTKNAIEEILSNYHIPEWFIDKMGDTFPRESLYYIAQLIV